MKITPAFFLCLLFTAIGFGQNKTAYSGTWIYDKVVSQPNETLRTAGFRMVVAQTDSDVKIATISGNAQSNDSPSPDDIVTYYFNKENTQEIQGTQGKVPVIVKAELTSKGKLILNTEFALKMSDGSTAAIKVKETFEKSSDGNSMKINREVQNSKGLPILEMTIAKKQSAQTNTDSAIEDATNLKTQFSQGVLNGRVKHLEVPPYPSGASANRATGVVQVRVIFDEEGKVTFAQAVLGHPLLKGAAVEAAMKCTFEPVELNGKLIKVSGIILFNFNH